MITFDEVFVTVGTTSFKALVKRFLDEETIKALQGRGCKKLVIQAGSSRINLPNLPFEVRVFDYRNSIINNIKSASLIIGHSGAGTVLDVLSNQKPLIVVTNDDLMDNHQQELASKLEKSHYLVSCKVKDLPLTLQSFDPSRLQPFPQQQPHIFADFLDSIFLV